MNGLGMLFWSLRAFFLGRTAVAIEMLALRQQLAVFRHSVKRPRLRQRDRIFWVLLSRFWQHWQAHLVIVQPATVIRWHRQGFKIYWRWKSRTRTLGRPRVDAELRELIRRMSRENPTWGAPRIQSELALLGHQVCESTVAKYMVRYPKPPSQTWRTFLMNHMKETVAIDFFTVPTATFRVLYVFLVLRHERREVIHFNVTQYPTSSWTAQQLVEAFPYDESPKYLLRDNDSIYGEVFQLRVQNLGIDEIKTAYRSPWQNPYAERLIGSIRRDCLDHMIVLNERHLKRILMEYFDYYHKARTHLSLKRNSPIPRSVESPDRGPVVSTSALGGLHHRYSRRAA